MKPLIRWVGGKYHQPNVIEIVRDCYARHGGSWIEPFCGGLGMALQINPDRAILSDLNRHLIDFYRGVQEGGSFCQVGEYYELRSLFNKHALEGRYVPPNYFWNLQSRSHNGIWRENASGAFNVPEGRSKDGIPRGCPEVDWSAYQELLMKWEFQCQSYEELAPPSGSFLYLDPPYDEVYSKYQKGDFYWEDQVKLVEWAIASNCTFVISNSASDRIVELYRSHGLTIHEVVEKRNVRAKGDRTANALVAVKEF